MFNKKTVNKKYWLTRNMAQVRIVGSILQFRVCTVNTEGLPTKFRLTRKSFVIKILLLAFNNNNK